MVNWVGCQFLYGVNKKIFWYLVKLAVSAALLWLLFLKVDLAALRTEISVIGMGYFVLAFFMLISSWVFSTEKWRRLLKIFDFNQKFLRLFLYNLVSVFYNVVLPGGKVAGDAVRAYQVARDHDGDIETKKRIALVVFLDRGFMMVSFLVFISIYLLMYPAAAAFLPYGAIFRYVFGGVLVLGIISLFLPVFDFILPAFLRSIVLRLRLRKIEIFKILGVSFVSVLVSASSVYILAYALGISIGFLTVAFFNSLAVMLVIIPVTIAGIGLRESGLTYLFFQAGVPFPKALALTALNLLLMLSLAAVGGIFEFYYHFLKKQK